jgi:hypothetical protein
MTNSTKPAPTVSDFRHTHAAESSATGSAPVELPRFLDTRGAAALLGISPRTLEKYRVCGGGPTYRKLGARVLYAIEDLDAWVAQAIRNSTSDPGPTQLAEPPPAKVDRSRRSR